MEELNRQTTPQSERLSALCGGSDEEPYSLSAQVNAQGVQETRCSCPYEYDGLCKHLVALLLAWAHTPEAFEETQAVEPEPVTESALFLELRNRERDELAQIIAQLVEAEPKLRPLVRRLMKARLSHGDVAKTERAVAAQLRKVARAGYETSFSQVRRELLFHLRDAASVALMRPGNASR